MRVQGIRPRADAEFSQISDNKTFEPGRPVDGWRSVPKTQKEVFP